MASAINLPISSSAADIAATLDISSLPSTGLDIACISSTAFLTATLIPFLINIGLAPAVTFFKPSLTIACAKSVAVVVPSPATSLVFVATSFTS